MTRIRSAARRSRARWLVVLAASLLVLGCARGEPTAQSDQNSQRRAQELIEAGNQAYRAGNYGLAARRYAAAAAVKEDDPAAYYGMGMALGKLGRDEEARKAYSKARELAQSSSAEAPPSH
jgi:Flp pilus assembly protein TadD